jgi:hypothetical protein
MGGGNKEKSPVQEALTDPTTAHSIIILNQISSQEVTGCDTVYSWIVDK